MPRLLAMRETGKTRVQNIIRGGLSLQCANVYRVEPHARNPTGP